MLDNFLCMLFVRFTIMKYSTETFPVKYKAHYRPGQALKAQGRRASITVFLNLCETAAR